jgi:DNA-directed RNA polymerase specialized sigma24 family protein
MDSAQIPAFIQTFGPQLTHELRGQMSPNLQQKVDPEDIVQSVFASLFGKGKYRESVLGWREPELQAISRYRAERRLTKKYRYWRREKRDMNRDRPQSELASVADDNSSRAPRQLSERGGRPLAEAMIADFFEWLAARIREQHPDNPEYGDIPELKWLEEYENKEIAKMLECNLRTVTRILREAASALHPLLIE